MNEWMAPSPETHSSFRHIHGYRLHVHLPGVDKEHIMVAFVDGCVEVYGRAQTEWEETAPGIRYHEREEMAAHHLIPLPADADAAQARVTLADGEVLIEIPRAATGHNA